MKTGIQLSPPLAVSHICVHGHTGSMGLMDTCHTCSQPPLGSFSSFIFKAGTVSSLYVCEVLSTTRLGPLGAIMTINNHNSGVRCFQIPNLHSSELPTAHTHPPCPSLLLSLTSALAQSSRALFLEGLTFSGGFPGSPLGLRPFLCRQVGRDGTAMNLFTPCQPGPRSEHVLLSLEEITADGGKEQRRGCVEPETAASISRGQFSAGIIETLGQGVTERSLSLPSAFGPPYEFVGWLLVTPRRTIVSISPPRTGDKP